MCIFLHTINNIVLYFHIEMNKERNRIYFTITLCTLYLFKFLTCNLYNIRIRIVYRFIKNKSISILINLKKNKKYSPHKTTYNCYRY